MHTRFDRKFLEVPELDMGRLETAWQESVFALYLAEEKIEPEVVENMRSWPPATAKTSTKRKRVDPAFRGLPDPLACASCLYSWIHSLALRACIPGSTRLRFELVFLDPLACAACLYSCPAFPEADGDGRRPGPKRKFQVLDPLDFLAEFTQHIPPKGSHLIRYYGRYSNKSRGMRRKSARGRYVCTAGHLPMRIAPYSLLAVSLAANFGLFRF